MKASPVEISQLWKKCFSDGIVNTLKGKISLMQVLQLWKERYRDIQELRNTTKLYHRTNLPQWERHKVAASAGMRSSWELGWRQAYIGFGREEFSSTEISIVGIGKSRTRSKPSDWWVFFRQRLVNFCHDFHLEVGSDPLPYTIWGTMMCVASLPPRKSFVAHIIQYENMITLYLLEMICI